MFVCVYYVWWPAASRSSYIIRQYINQALLPNINPSVHVSPQACKIVGFKIGLCIYFWIYLMTAISTQTKPYLNGLSKMRQPLCHGLLLKLLITRWICKLLWQTLTTVIRRCTYLYICMPIWMSCVDTSPVVALFTSHDSVLWLVVCLSKCSQRQCPLEIHLKTTRVKFIFFV